MDIGQLCCEDAPIACSSRSVEQGRPVSTLPPTPSQLVHPALSSWSPSLGKHTIVQLVVFLGEPIRNTPNTVHVRCEGKQPTLQEVLQATNEQVTNISIGMMKDITVLHSPFVQTFSLDELPQEQWKQIQIPSTAVVVIHDNESQQPDTQEEEPAAPKQHFTTPLRAGRHLKEQKVGHRPQNAEQDELRARVTALLNNRETGFSLDLLANMTSFSKSSLSLWRRDMYKGTGKHVAKAVREALEALEVAAHERTVQTAVATPARPRPNPSKKRKPAKRSKAKKRDFVETETDTE